MFNELPAEQKAEYMKLSSTRGIDTIEQAKERMLAYITFFSHWNTMVSLADINRRFGSRFNRLGLQTAGYAERLVAEGILDAHRHDRKTWLYSVAEMNSLLAELRLDAEQMQLPFDEYAERGRLKAMWHRNGVGL